MSAQTKNPYALLRTCRDVAVIDDLLDEVGLPRQMIDKRLYFLYDLMGIRQTFCSNELTIEEKYAIAKEELASQIWNEE